jgi:hypothetical protein
VEVSGKLRATTQHLLIVAGALVVFSVFWIVCDVDRNESNLRERRILRITGHLLEGHAFETTSTIEKSFDTLPTEVQELYIDALNEFPTRWAFSSYPDYPMESILIETNGEPTFIAFSPWLDGFEDNPYIKEKRERFSQLRKGLLSVRKNEDKVYVDRK